MFISVDIIFGRMPEYLYIRIQNQNISIHGTERIDKRLLEEAEKGIALYHGFCSDLGLDTSGSPH
jgi:hypothetical protein